MVKGIIQSSVRESERFKHGGAWEAISTSIGDGHSTGLLHGVREGNCSMSDGFRTPLGDPHLLVSELYRANGRGNYTGYSNLEIDRLLDQAGGIFDTAQARAIYDQVKTIIAEDATTIYKMWSTEFTLMGSNVQNFIRTPDLDLRLREVWMSK